MAEIQARGDKMVAAITNQRKVLDQLERWRRSRPAETRWWRPSPTRGRCWTSWSDGGDPGPRRQDGGGHHQPEEGAGPAGAMAEIQARGDKMVAAITNQRKVL